MASVVWDLGIVLCPDVRPVAALIFRSHQGRWSERHVRSSIAVG